MFLYTFQISNTAETINWYINETSLAGYLGLMPEHSQLMGSFLVFPFCRSLHEWSSVTIYSASQTSIEYCTNLHCKSCKSWNAKIAIPRTLPQVWQEISTVAGDYPFRSVVNQKTIWSSTFWKFKSEPNTKPGNSHSIPNHVFWHNE